MNILVCTVPSLTLDRLDGAADDDDEPIFPKGPCTHIAVLQMLPSLHVHGS